MTREGGWQLGMDPLRRRLRAFARERDWEQFHHAKNLSMALAAEAGELLELFQWMSDEQSRDASSDLELMTRARDEVADVLIYLVRLADVLGIDLAEAADSKVERNALRYPVETSRGRSAKAPS